MSRGKDILKPYAIVGIFNGNNSGVSGDMSAPITSLPTNIQFLDNIALELIFTGTPTGTFSVQASCDYRQDAEGNVQNVGNWVPINLPATPVASGSAGVIIVDLNQLASAYVRVVYTPSSGSGALIAIITAKQL